uniref:Neuropeptide-like 4 n=1 Tax=Coptotermes formosanus TaxID=36987 RepID=R4UV58_COPFO|nr:hypothetical protein [Coptotermes formosanus]
MRVIFVLLVAFLAMISAAPAPVPAPAPAPRPSAVPLYTYPSVLTYSAYASPYYTGYVSPYSYGYTGLGYAYSYPYVLI